MKGSFPRDCLISAYLHLLAKHSHGRTDAEVHGHAGTLQIIEKSLLRGDISAAGTPSKVSRVTCSSVCSVRAGLHGISLLFIFNSESHGYSVS